MSLQAWQLIFEISIFLMGLYLVFFKSYLTEKGKNAATKEDIEEITKKVERVRNEVKLLTDKRISFSALKVQSLIELNNKYSIWLDSLIAPDLPHFSSGFTEAEIKITNSISSAYTSYVLAESTFSIFNETNLEFQNLKKELLNITAGMYAKLITAIHKISELVGEYSDLKELAPGLDNHMNILKVFDKYENIHEEFYANRFADFDKAETIRKLFVDWIRNTVKSEVNE